MIFLVLADVVWPALFLSIRMAAWWCILASLSIEAIALWRFAKVPPMKAVAASVTMNLVSALLGTALIPLLGLRLENFADLTYNAWLGWGTFNPITFATTWIGATILTTLIEGFTLWLVFAMSWRWRWICVVLAANALTVALAGASVLIFAPK